MRRYDTFLLRHWTLESGLERIEVTHIQSGERVLLATLEEAKTWMEDRAAATAREPGPMSALARGPPARVSVGATPSVIDDQVSFRE